MTISESEKQAVMDLVKAAFPRLRGWDTDYDDGEYRDFGVCGCLRWGKGTDVRFFYVTIDLYKGQWSGYLTIGQPAFFWSSAGLGHAYLLDVKAGTARGAITRLKRSMRKLFDSLGAS